VTNPTPPQTAAERLAALIRPEKEPKRKIEHTDFLKMMWRMARALELRAIDDPQILLQVLALVQRLDEIVNVAIAVNADRYALNKFSGASMAECARALQMSDPAASKRRKKGNEIILRRLDAAGAVDMTNKRNRKTTSEAAREASAIKEAQNEAVTRLADYIKRRSAA
jgi:hypothetical protein